ncbi:MAG TPA: hypothetical protein VJY65_06950 [Chloroflexota bacterium]|nr:hypothetical protein [Chloroflexota bacterium]
MNTTTTIPAWVDKIQADITATEWEWRQLDEQEWRSRERDGQVQTALAKQEKQAEVGRLRAELAVASFLDAFHTGQQSAVGRTVAAQWRVHSWTDAIINRLGFALFVQAEAERTVLPGVEMRWGPATSSGDPVTAQWRVDVEAVYLWHGEELSQHRYRFHVVEERVEGWMALVEARQAGKRGPSANATIARLPRPLRLMAQTVARLSGARRCA